MQPPNLPFDPLAPENLLRAYQLGIFPMAESVDSKVIQWVRPHTRGIFPLDGFHVPRRLARIVRCDRFQVVIDRDFRGVMEACAAWTPERSESWINPDIIDAYCRLFELGHAHSVECLDQDGAFAGGLYGVSIGGAFFGESMVTKVRDASKVALVHLVGRLLSGGFTLLDAQFTNPHLERFGAATITQEDYLTKLHHALGVRGQFYSMPAVSKGSDVLHEITHTS
ncbi:MAG: leucyl/phenylalanyl-tRNA--protein transferase [Pseudomonadota bacterium]